MRITTKHLLHILPIDEEIRTDLLTRFDSLSEDQQLEIKEVCWTMFYTLMEEESKHAFSQALLDVKNGKGKLSSHMFQDIQEQVYNSYKTKMHEMDQQGNLHQVRESLDRLQTLSQSSS